MVGVGKLAKLLYEPLLAMFAMVFAQLRDHAALEKRVAEVEDRLSKLEAMPHHHSQRNLLGQYKKA